MKRISRIIIVSLLMLSALATVVALHLGSGAKSVSQGDRPLSTTGLSLSDEEFALCTGESYLCGAFYDGQKLTDARWFSSDPSIASVASDGMITAHSVGQVTIRAEYSEHQEVEATLWVYTKPDASAAKIIRSLASDGGDDAFLAFATLARQLACAKNYKVKPLADLLDGLVQFGNQGAGGSGSPEKAWQQIQAAQRSLDGGECQSIDADTLRQAALSAYCQGEKLAGNMTLSFVGDCTFAYFNETDSPHMFPSVYRQSGSLTYPFDLTRSVFAADDLTVVNLEGTLTQSRRHKDKTFYFRGEPAYVDILTHSSVEAVTVENNHSMDYFDEGYNDTLRFLGDAKIRYTTALSPAVTEIGTYRVVLLSLSMVGGDYTPALRTEMEAAIRSYRNSDTVIIVNLHWGVEGSSVPESWQVEAAHSMIDAGADMVVGHHPHVLQGIEVYNGHYIAYSLGNFSFGGNSSARSPDTVILRASFTDDSNGSRRTRVSVVPCLTTSSGSTVNNFQPMPLFGSRGDAAVNRLLTLSAKLDHGIPVVSWHRIPD
ncbi:MAG: CapA family protein [Clostridia bacterium]|nr:CapA family protein [Clostridia bacterium]